MQKTIIDRIDLPALEDGAACTPSRNVKLENSVAPGFRTQHSLQRFGIDADGKVVAFAAIDNTRDQTLPAEPPRGVFPATSPVCRIHYDFGHKELQRLNE